MLYSILKNINLCTRQVSQEDADRQEGSNKQQAGYIIMRAMRHSPTIMIHHSQH